MERISEKDPILGLMNPYSKATCLLLYLYSMELGTPPLYAEVNRAARDLDLTQIKTLGPFIQALTWVTIVAEGHKRKGDKETPGFYFSQEEDNMSGSFLLFRGAPMKDDWL